MNKEQANKALEELREEFEKKANELQEIIDKPSDKRFKPEYCRRYWYVNSYGKVDWACSSDIEWDVFRYNSRNCFKTKEEAKEELKRINICNEYFNLAEESWGAEIDWNNKWQGKHQIEYNYMSVQMYFDIAYHIKNKSNKYYFSCKEALKDAINQIGEENVKKYVLEVK